MIFLYLIVHRTKPLKSTGKWEKYWKVREICQLDDVGILICQLSKLRSTVFGYYTVNIGPDGPKLIWQINLVSVDMPYKINFTSLKTNSNMFI